LPIWRGKKRRLSCASTPIGQGSNVIIIGLTVQAIGVDRLVAIRKIRSNALQT